MRENLGGRPVWPPGRGERQVGGDLVYDAVWAGVGPTSAESSSGQGGPRAQGQAVPAGDLRWVRWRLCLKFLVCKVGTFTVLSLNGFLSGSDGSTRVQCAQGVAAGVLHAAIRIQGPVVSRVTTALVVRGSRAGWRGAPGCRGSCLSPCVGPGQARADATSASAAGTRRAGDVERRSPGPRYPSVLSGGTTRARPEVWPTAAAVSAGVEGGGLHGRVLLVSA